jgi:hypothetical protein
MADGGHEQHPASSTYVAATLLAHCQPSNTIMWHLHIGEGSVYNLKCTTSVNKQHLPAVHTAVTWPHCHSFLHCDVTEQCLCRGSSTSAPAQPWERLLSCIQSLPKIHHADVCWVLLKRQAAPASPCSGHVVNATQVVCNSGQGRLGIAHNHNLGTARGSDRAVKPPAQAAGFRL